MNWIYKYIIFCYKLCFEYLFKSLLASVCTFSSSIVNIGLSKIFFNESIAHEYSFKAI